MYQVISPLVPDGSVQLARRDDLLATPTVLKRRPLSARADVARLRTTAERVATMGDDRLVGVVDIQLHAAARAADAEITIVTPALEAPTLSQMVGDAHLPAGSVAEIAVDLLGAVDSLHRAGLVHGAIHAANVHVAPEGVRLVDIGVSDALAGEHQHPDDDLRAVAELLAGLLDPSSVEPVDRELLRLAHTMASGTHHLAAARHWAAQIDALAVAPEPWPSGPPEAGAVVERHFPFPVAALALALGIGAGVLMSQVPFV